MGSSTVLDAVVSLQAAVDDVLKCLDAGELAGLDGEEFVEVVREIEAARRRFATTDYAVVEEVAGRDLPDQSLSRNPAGFLAQVLRLSPGVARARVAEAQALGERRALTGAVLAPVRPRLAGARRLGVLDGEHVRVALRGLRELPPWLDPSDVD